MPHIFVDSQIVISMAVTDAESDLSSVSAASFSVLKPGPAGIEATWDASFVLDAATAEITVLHQLVPGDIDVPGTYAIFAELTTPEGTLRTKTRTFVAKKKFDTTV